jgi:hypothetical protein
MSRWDLARARSQQPARRYKPVGPVGEVPVGDDHDMVMRTPISLLADQDYCACGDCGYHVCSCKPEYVPHVFRPPPTPPAPSIRGRIDTLERFRELGMLDTPGQREAIYRVLLDGDYSGFGVKP